MLKDIMPRHYFLTNFWFPVYWSGILKSLQRAASELSAHQKKILPIDDHVAVSIAGLTADARLLRSYFIAHLMYMLQVRLNLQVNSFQPRSICFNPGQFVST